MNPEVALSEAPWKHREEWTLGDDCRPLQLGLGRDAGERLYLILPLELHGEDVLSSLSLSLQILMDHISKDQSM